MYKSGRSLWICLTSKHFPDVAPSNRPMCLSRCLSCHSYVSMFFIAQCGCFMYHFPCGVPPPVMFDRLMLEPYHFRGRRGTGSEAIRVARRREYRRCGRMKALLGVTRPVRHGLIRYSRRALLACLPRASIEEGRIGHFATKSAPIPEALPVIEIVSFLLPAAALPA